MHADPAGHQLDSALHVHISQVRGPHAGTGRKSLERLLPHYLLGLSQFVNGRKPAAAAPLLLPSPIKPQPAPQAVPSSKNGARWFSSPQRPKELPVGPSGTQHAHALGSFAPVKLLATPPSSSQGAHQNMPVSRPLNARGDMGAAQPSQHPAPPQPRRSFCGDMWPETAEAGANLANLEARLERDDQEQRNRNARKSAFFSCGKTEPTLNSATGRRSRTFDLGYGRSEVVGVPARRGPWGEPQIIPGPGAALGNVNGGSCAGAVHRHARGSQDDTVMQSTELPQYGRDLAADGMLEFEEMMARRVRMLQGDVHANRDGNRRHGDPRSAVPRVPGSEKAAQRPAAPPGPRL